MFKVALDDLRTWFDKDTAESLYQLCQRNLSTVGTKRLSLPVKNRHGSTTMRDYRMKAYSSDEIIELLTVNSSSPNTKLSIPKWRENTSVIIEKMKEFKDD